MTDDNSGKRPKKQTREYQGWEQKEFLPTQCLELIKTMGKGLGFQTFAANNNMSRGTFYIWIKTYPDFGLAYQVGKSFADRYMIGLLEEYKIEIGPEGTERLNVNIWKELYKVTRTSVDKKESLMFLSAGSPRSMMTSVLEALGAGLIDMEEADALAKLIESAQRIEETSELMAKIEALESQLSSGTPSSGFKEE